MCCMCGLVTVCLFDLSVEACNKPVANPNRRVIPFDIREAHVVHQEEYLLEINLFSTIRQAKKTLRRGAD